LVEHTSKLPLGTCTVQNTNTVTLLTPKLSTTDNALLLQTLYKKDLLFFFCLNMTIESQTQDHVNDAINVNVQPENGHEEMDADFLEKRIS
jgi:hypothetical protein